MQYARYGKDGPEISRLGFGVMRLPARRKGDWGSVNFTRSVAVMRKAMELGVNFFDSHHFYHNGLSEVAIGQALKGWKGQRIYIQTKTPFYNRKPLKHFKELLVQALEKTGVNRLDYLLFHSMSMDTFRSRGRQFFKLTDWAIKRGLIRFRGFSSHDTPENVRAFIDTGEFSAMLVSYNFLNPTIAETIAYAADRGMGVSVMNPVGGGTLAATTPEILRLLPGARSSSEVALRYVMATPGVSAALSGMSTEAQVEENVATASRKTPMTERQRRAMLARLESIRQRATRICTSCGYCMPCPQGVDIPQNFLLLNRARLFGLVESGRAGFRRLRSHKEGDRSATACVACGRCLSKCPNEIPIIDQLKDVADLLG
ncbi:MAG: aldo/keto reductase [Phycisphaerae bacterium]|nr:aldo/keto reductase [Phycisphaerae bacterium]